MFLKNSRWLRSRVSISFKTHQVMTLKRSEAYTFANFLSMCGGLLGLFLGVSALSVTEVIYYFSLRLFWTIRKWKPTNIVAPFKRQIIPNISGNVPSAYEIWSKLFKTTFFYDFEYWLINAWVWRDFDIYSMNCFSKIPCKQNVYNHISLYS